MRFGRWALLNFQATLLRNTQAIIPSIRCLEIAIQGSTRDLASTTILLVPETKNTGELEAIIKVIVLWAGFRLAWICMHAVSVYTRQFNRTFNIESTKLENSIKMPPIFMRKKFRLVILRLNPTTRRRRKFHKKTFLWPSRACCLCWCYFESFLARYLNALWEMKAKRGNHRAHI